MKLSVVKEIINETINRCALSAYLCADSNERFAVYPMYWMVGKDVGMESNPNGRPIVVVGCPGWQDVDESFFTDGEVYDSESDSYVNEPDINGYRAHYSPLELISLTCEYGNVDDELQKFKNHLLECYALSHFKIKTGGD